MKNTNSFAWMGHLLMFLFLVCVLFLNYPPPHIYWVGILAVATYFIAIIKHSFDFVKNKMSKQMGLDGPPDFNEEDILPPAGARLKNIEDMYGWPLCWIITNTSDLPKKVSLSGDNISKVNYGLPDYVRIDSGDCVLTARYFLNQLASENNVTTDRIDIFGGDQVNIDFGVKIVQDKDEATLTFAPSNRREFSPGHSRSINFKPGVSLEFMMLPKTTAVLRIYPFSNQYKVRNNIK